MSVLQWSCPRQWCGGLVSVLHVTFVLQAVSLSQAAVWGSGIYSAMLQAVSLSQAAVWGSGIYSVRDLCVAGNEPVPGSGVGVRSSGTCCLFLNTLEWWLCLGI